MKGVVLLAVAVVLVCSLEGVEELTDANFEEKVYGEPKFWLVMFSASWCGHCTHLKPEIEKVAPLLGELGVAVGHVGEDNQKLVNDFVVDHKTHMVSYPKLFVFLGQENLGQVPGGLRTAAQLYNWFKNEYKLAEAPQEEEL